MRIAVNGRFLLQGRLEGIGWFCNEVIQRMVHKYPQHEFILFFDRPFHEDFIYSENVKGVVLNPPARHPFLWYWWFEHSIPKALIKYKADIFISMDGFCSLSTDVPQYLVVHDLAYVHFPEQVMWLYQRFYQYFVPKYLAKAKHLFAVSEATKKDMIQQFSLLENKIDICYNGCRPIFRKLNFDEIAEVRKQYSNGNPYFLFVGALHPRKNVHGLISAFDSFKEKHNKEFELIIVGRKAWMTKEIEQAYHTAKYKKNIIFQEIVDNNELAKLTGAAFASIAPSFLEGFGVPTLEALYCEVPVLCSNKFSLPEVAGPGAILFDPYQRTSITNAMLEIVNDSNLQARIQLGNIHRNQFSWDLTTEVICNKIFRFKSD